jgi:hypothetical protein
MQTQTRLVGSGFTAFTYAGQPIAFLDEVHDSGQQPIRQYEAVTPLDALYPAEFALPRVRAEGTLQLVVRELWNQPVWWALGKGSTGNSLAGTYNIVDVYNKMAATTTPIVCQTIIKSPITNPKPTWRGWTYHNCVVTAIDDREAVQIGTLTFPRNLSLIYAYKTNT